LCLIQPHALFQASDDFPVVGCARWEPWIKPARDPEVYVGRKIEPRRHHPDYRNNVILSDKPLLRQIRVTAEIALPEAVADNHGRQTAIALFFNHKPAPYERGYSEHVEKTARNNGQRGAHRFIAAGHGDERLAELRQRLEGAALLPPLIERGVRGPGSSPFSIDLPDLNNLVRLWIGQRTQQDAVDDAEDGRVRPHAQREREHGHGSEAGVLQQLAEGVAKVVHRMNGWVDGWMNGLMVSTATDPFIQQSTNPNRAAPCFSLESFISQRLHGVDFRGAPRRDDAGQQRHDQQQHWNQREGEGIQRT